MKKSCISHMMANNKVTRIFEKLQKAGSKGVQQSDLFHDFESDGSLRQTRYLFRQTMGKDSLVIKNGTWYLSEEYWEVTRAEFKDRLQIQTLSKMNSRTVSIMSVMSMAMFVFGVILGYYLCAI